MKAPFSNTRTNSTKKVHVTERRKRKQGVIDNHLESPCSRNKKKQKRSDCKKIQMGKIKLTKFKAFRV